MKTSTTYANAISPNQRLDGFVGIRPDGKRMYFYNTHRHPEPLVFAVFARKTPRVWSPDHKQWVADLSVPCGPWRRVALIADRSYPDEPICEIQDADARIACWSKPIHTLTPREKAEQHANWYHYVIRDHEARVIALRPVNSGSPTEVVQG